VAGDCVLFQVINNRGGKRCVDYCENNKDNGADNKNHLSKKGFLLMTV